MKRIRTVVIAISSIGAAIYGAATVGCSSMRTPIHPLEGKTAVIEGRWNGLAKEEAQVLCATEPRIVEVVEIGGRAVPKQGQKVRVTAVLHWRGASAEEEKWAEENAVQAIPAGYIIRWPEASWQPD